MLRGFDVSAFQGSTVRKADFVFIKATEGSTYTSSKFNAQWADAKAKGMLRGAYHFARPEASSGASQADRLLAKAKPVPGEMLCLDLEASKLNQAKTNAWAKAFGDRLRAKAPGVTTVVYMGGGYASNGTGRDLNQHFDWWWFPQYPSTASTTTWRTSFSPSLPGGLTCGWTHPHIWQWTDNFAGLDANISTLTLEQLAGRGQPTPMEDDMIERELKPGLDSKTEFLLPPGKVSMFVANADNSFQNTSGVKATAPVQIRVAIRKADGTWQSKTGTVGRSATDKNQPEFKLPLADTKSTFVSVTRVDGDGTEPVVVGAY
jgi:hypothetical protein